MASTLNTAINLTLPAMIGRVQEDKMPKELRMGENSQKMTPPDLHLCTRSSPCVRKETPWWEKNPAANIVEIRSAQHLVEALLAAGDRLAVVGFYSPECGGCKSLHPKLCQLAEENSSVVFLKVNFEEMKAMCHELNVHVLPFFRFYRGAEGKICSFSCTLSTIKKFKDALMKNSAKSYGSGQPKGLDASEIISLASAGELPLHSQAEGFALPMRF